MRIQILRFALFIAAALLVLPGCARETQPPAPALGLPHEAQATLALIQRGGPFPFRKDGTVFQNREQRLPPKSRGYYREFTVPTPGERDRGARRIVSGGDPPEVFYYSGDHYRTFRRIEPRQ